MLYRLWIRLSQGAQRDAVDGNEGMVPHNINPIALPKIRVEPVPHTRINPLGKPQVVITRQATYELASRLARPPLQASIPPMRKEYPSKPAVLVHPKVVTVPSPHLIRIRMRMRRPLPPSVEQISQKEHRIRIQHLLYARVRTSKILVDVSNRKIIQRPRATGVGMRIYELRVCDEDEPMRVCALLLCSD